MRRRDFITLLGGAAASWPIAARAQRPGLPVIGYLSSRTPEAEVPFLGAFRRGLATTGYIENMNVVFEYRFANGEYEGQAALALDLVRRQVAVVVAAGNLSASLAAKAATSSIPIVFTFGADPVKYGLVASLNHPGGNMTGVYSRAGELGTKNLGLLHDLVPQANTIGLLTNPSSPVTQDREPDVGAAAASLGLRIRLLEASTAAGIDAVFANLTREPVDAILVMTDPFFVTRAPQIVGLVERHRLPAIYGRRPFAEAGGLISYSDDVADSYRQLGVYSGQILKGKKPDDLPVWQTDRFELVINLKAAKALGLTIPPTLLAIADEVIE
jgi:putative ABC transport system substrate-binding protein